MRLTLLTATGVLCAVAPAAAGLTRPAGTYTGDRGRIVMSVDRRSIEIVAIDFRCGSTRGATSVSAIPIRKVRGRWRFSIRTFGLATYADDHPDENVRVRLSGRFSPSARLVVGRYRIRARHCGRTRAVSWRAYR